MSEGVFLSYDLMEMIFSKLAPKDLMTATLVCRSWRDLCQNSSSLWNWVVITITQSNISTLPQMLKSVRLRGLRKLVIGVKLSDDILLHIQKWKCLTYLNLNDYSNDLNILSSCHLELVNKVENVVLGGSGLCKEQLENIFTNFQDVNRLKTLHLDINMALVEPILIAPLASLTSLRISGPSLSSLQLQILLTAIGKENRMKILNISWNDLSSVNPLLISSLGKLLSLNVSNSRLTTAQLEILITAIGKENRMEILNITKNDLSSVNPLLISSLGKL